MKLLNLASTENVVSATPDPHALLIKEFKQVNDKEDKPERIFAYIYHMHNNDSNYANYNSKMREQEIKEDLFGDVKYKLSDIAKEAEDKYIELTTTPEKKLLDSAINTVYKLIDYFEAFEPTERDDRGKLVWNTKDLIKNMGSLKDVVNSLEDLRERVEKGEGQKGKVRGGTTLNKYNRGNE